MARRHEPPPPAISEQEFEEIFQRNKTVSSSAINRAVMDASSGQTAAVLCYGWRSGGGRGCVCVGKTVRSCTINVTFIDNCLCKSVCILWRVLGYLCGSFVSGVNDVCLEWVRGGKGRGMDRKMVFKENGMFSGDTALDWRKMWCHRNLFELLTSIGKYQFPTPVLLRLSSHKLIF